MQQQLKRMRPKIKTLSEYNAKKYNYLLFYTVRYVVNVVQIKHERPSCQQLQALK